MAFEECPNCKIKKHQLAGCRNCGFTRSKGIIKISSIIENASARERNKRKLDRMEITPGQERNQRMGFHDGAKVPGSNIRKIDK